MNGEEMIRNQKLWYARIEEMLSSDISPAAAAALLKVVAEL
jgi:hypothetical protein